MRTSAGLMMVLTIVLGACAGQGGGEGTKSTAGTVLGAGLGGLAGAQIGSGSGKLAAVAAGTLLGALLGHEAGTSLDRADKVYAEQAEQKAHSAPIGQHINWNNPQSGNAGSVTPLRDGTATDGSYCREYQTTITVGGKTRKAYGTACRQPDGSWKVVS